MVLRRVAALLTAMVLATAASAAASSVTYQANPAHDGHVADGALSPPLALKWDRALPGSVSYPLVADGRVIVTSATPGGAYGVTLHALSAADGSVLWERAIGGTYYRAGIAYDAGRVFVVDFDGMVRAIDAGTGAEVWATSIGDHFASSPPTAVNGVVYVEADSVRALRQSDGHLLWTSPRGSGSGQSSPAFDGTRVFVSGTTPQIDAFDARTGQSVWHYDEGTTGGGGRTPVVHDGRLYTRDGTGGRVFEAATGKVLGSLAAGPAPALAAGTMVYGAGERLFAEDAPSRTPLWSVAGPFTSAPLIVNGRAYAATGAGTLHAFELRTGKELWACATGREIPGPDEHNYSAPLAGLGAGHGLLVVPYTGGVMAFGSAAASSCPAPQAPGEPAPGPAAGQGPAATQPQPAVDFGGGVTPGVRRGGVAVSVRRDGERLHARVGLFVECRRTRVPQVIARGTGTVSGESFGARFTTRVVRGLRLRTTITGTFAGEVASGTIRTTVRRSRGGPRGCRSLPPRKFTLRTANPPGGSPARPAPRTVVRGLTTQDAGGIQLPAMLSVTRDGRYMVARWLALADCGRVSASVDNYTPRTRLRRHGSFSKPERYSIRYDDGTVDRYRVSFSGRFLADGAVGRLRVRITTRYRGRTLLRCDSGPQTFTAR